MKLFERLLILITIPVLGFLMSACKQERTIIDPVFGNHLNIIYTVNEDIFIMNGNGTDKQNLTQDLDGFNLFSDISKDGQYILFTNVVPDTINLRPAYTTYIMDLDGTHKKNLNNAYLRPLHSRFSPDGNLIVFDATINMLDIYLMDSNGGNIRNLTNDDDSDYFPQFSKDGSQILFISVKESGTDLYGINLNGSKKVNLTHDGNLTQDCCISTDGLKIAYTSLEGGQANIYMMDTDGTHKKQLTDSRSNSRARISQDNAKIAYISWSESGYNIQVMDSDGNNPRTVCSTERPNLDDYWRPCVLFSPDYEHILFTRYANNDVEIYIADLTSKTIKNLTNNPGVYDMLACILPAG
jgi:Tol biopolymer transport system component